MKKDLKKSIFKKGKKVKMNSLMINMSLEEETSKIVDKIQNTELIFLMENMTGKIITTKDEKVKIDLNDKYLKIKKESNTLRTENKDYEYAIKKSRFISMNNPIFLKYIIKYYFNSEDFNFIYAMDYKYSDRSFEIKKENDSDVYLLKFDDHFYDTQYKGDDVLKKIKVYNQILINLLCKLEDNFNQNNNFIIYLLTLNDKTIPIIQLYSLFFEKIIMIGKDILICVNYKKNIGLNINEIIKKNYIFSIHSYNDKKKKKLINYMNDLYKINILNLKKFIKTRNENEFIVSRYISYFNLIRSIGIQYEKEFIDELSLYYVNLFKLKIYSKDDIKKIEANINSREGTYISNIIKKHDYKKCFEVGLAHGISSIYILKNPGTSLISIDPFQKSQWDNQALKFIKHLGYDKNHSLMEKKSHVALPEMLEKYGEDSFDFSFIDGDHKFDVTLLDFYYSSLLVRIGGTIIIDDALHAGVNKCIKFIDTNMSNFKKLESPNTIAVYKKVREDKREWFYHKNF
jgi:predicted O-methyltransferase YrrM